MLNKAVELRWLNSSPRVERPKISMYDQSFKFLATDEEIQRFLRSAIEKSELHSLVYATAIYTGMREGEIAGLKWSDINFDKRLITVRHSYEGPTESGRPRHVPILDPILIPLKEWRLRNPLEWVFPNRYGLMLKPCSRIFQEDLRAILRAAGFPDRITSKGTRGYIVFHDLRHTFASHWVMNGGDFYKLKEIMGHKDYAVTQRYSHFSPTAFSGDYGRLGKAPTTPSVLQLKR